MTPEQIAAKENEIAAAKEAEDKAKADAEAKSKVESLQRKNGERTRLEKLHHTAASIQAQIAEEEARNGIVITDDEDDDKPITKGDLKRIQREDAKKSALQLTNDIEDEEERSHVADILQTRIVSTGNPKKDFQTALDLANSEKNRQIAEEAARKKAKVTTRSTGTGMPPKEEDQFAPTDFELAAATMVGKKTPADIKAFVLKARAKEQQ